MKFYNRKVYRNSLVCPRGRVFNVSAILNGNLLDEDELKTLKFGLGNTVCSWESVLDLSNIESSDWEVLLETYTMECIVK